MNKSIGVILLAVWLILGALPALIPSLTFPYEGMIHAVLGLLAGIFLLARK